MFEIIESVFLGLGFFFLMMASGNLAMIQEELKKIRKALED